MTGTLNQQALIMSRVLFLHRLRRAWRSPWSKVVLVVGLFLAEYSIVSIHHVVFNLWNSGGNAHNYFINAFTHTDHVAQILLVGLVLFFSLLAFDGVKSFRSARLHRHLATV